MEKRRYGQGRWSLAELMPERTGEALASALEGLEERTAALESMRPLLSADMGGDDFKKLLAALEEFAEAAGRLGGAGMLWFSENTQDHDALAFMGSVEERLAAARSRVLFVELWWRALEEGAARRLMSEAGGLGYYLARQRLFRKHTLSEPEEKIISLKDVNGVNALSGLYDMITNKFVFGLEVGGERKSMSREELSAFVRDPSAGVREAAYRELFRVYGEEATVLGQIYVHRVRDWAGENIGLRGFASPISARNLSNDLPDGVVDTLLEVCAEEAGVFHRYFGLKAGWLGQGGRKLSRFDLYAPAGGGSQGNIPYPEAVETVLEGLGRFSPELRDMALRVFEERHIDSELRRGKRGGAFCLSVSPSLTPWVLVNYTGEPRQVATLAHELGHAVHSMLASGHSPLAFQPALPLAETASVFCELLLTDHLLEKEKDPGLRKDILAETMDGIYATVMRQAFFVLFEREAHGLVSEGKTIEALHAAYMENLEAQFGDSVEVDEVFRHEWTGIPHIYHYPFYCYAYCFGMLLSLGLYRRYREEGGGFSKKLFGILEYGGSESPARILEGAGIDISDRGFWRGGFRAIEDMVRKLS